MAKFYGIIGYGIMTEDAPGVWIESIVEHNYYGETIVNVKDTQSSGNVNDNINVSNQISILSDPFANENFHKMKYVVFMGAKWKVKKVDVRRPRLLLTIGDIYNG